MSSSQPSRPVRPSGRRKLKNGSVIIPSTGERSRRQLSFRGTLSTELDYEDRSVRFKSILTVKSIREFFYSLLHNLGTATDVARRKLETQETRDILKCSLAYLLGSLATFLDPVSDFLGNRDGKHIVATITVYFHPARSLGSMIEAIITAIAAIIFAVLVAVAGMAVSVLLATRLGMPVLSHITVLVFFLGCSLGLLAWIKQKRNNPLTNVATTLASIAIISVLTTEDSVRGGEFSTVKIVQMLKMLMMGITITTAVNLLIWRVSARRNWRSTMGELSIALGDVLSIVTRGFLSGTEEELDDDVFRRAHRHYSEVYARMRSNLREAKFEHYTFGSEQRYKCERAVSVAIESLAQAIGRLRSASNLQLALKHEAPLEVSSPGPISPVANISAPLSTVLSRVLSGSAQGDTLFASPASSFLASSLPSSQQTRVVSDGPPLTEEAAPIELAPPAFRSPAEVFEFFMIMLGPSMKSLAWTLCEILREAPFGEAPLYDINLNEQFRTSLRDALALYNEARGSALRDLYESIEFDSTRPAMIEADIEEVAAACGHFSFSLQTVADELEAYLDAVEELKLAMGVRQRTWNWMKFWSHWSWFSKDTPAHDEYEPESLLPATLEPEAVPKRGLPKGIPASLVKQRDNYSWDAAPQSSRFVRAISQHVLKALRVIGRDDVRLGIKVAIGAIIWAMFAFIPSTRPTYQHWKGEWGLLSLMIVVGMTIGASNTTSFARFLGTVGGASMGFLGWVVSGGDALPLILFGWLFSLCNFYFILVVKSGPVGRITLLAWNVTVLYAYGLTRGTDENGDDLDDNLNPLMFEIWYHRIVSVTLGIVWGMIISRVIWPISGRRKFKEGLAVLYLQMGLIWRRGPLAILLNSYGTSSYLKTGEQAALRRYAFKLETLRQAAKNEFELRGPFPSPAYERIMQSTNSILDGFHAMSLVTQKRGTLDEGELALLKATAPERAQLCDLICHVFQVLASSVILEYPLTDSIPSIAGAKDRLLNKIHHFRKEHMEDTGNGGQRLLEEKDYAVLYSYTLVTAQVAEELGKVRNEIEGLFGTLNDQALLIT